MQDPDFDAAEVDIIAMILQQDMPFCGFTKILPDFKLADRHQFPECG
jgi:hypothetical protein